MFVLDRMLVGSIRFVLDKLVSAAEAEMNDEEGLRERLLEAQMQLELGEMTEEEFAAVERDVLAAMREIRERKEGADPGALDLEEGVSVVGATAEIAGDVYGDDEAGGGPERAWTGSVTATEAESGSGSGSRGRRTKRRKSPRRK